ncbi:hypothetical protein EVAR_17391_1 [Eumeta japonica]|uniref:Uncharacterized protein n=1 Tax=Eumeta variegata TaxID=151549 RepID=A0A4C1VAD9_EUMVA|nr:hypothetical protein EVAR_17391_1 [Eumeta japonica]
MPTSSKRMGYLIMGKKGNLLPELSLTGRKGNSGSYYSTFVFYEFDISPVKPSHFCAAAKLSATHRTRDSQLYAFQNSNLLTRQTISINLTDDQWTGRSSTATTEDNISAVRLVTETTISNLPADSNMLSKTAGATVSAPIIEFIWHDRNPRGRATGGGRLSARGTFATPPIAAAGANERAAWTSTCWPGAIYASATRYGENAIDELVVGHGRGRESDDAIGAGRSSCRPRDGLICHNGMERERSRRFCAHPHRRLKSDSRGPDRSSIRTANVTALWSEDNHSDHLPFLRYTSHTIEIWADVSFEIHRRHANLTVSDFYLDNCDAFVGEDLMLFDVRVTTQDCNGGFGRSPWRSRLLDDSPSWMPSRLVNILNIGFLN